MAGIYRVNQEGKATAFGHILTIMSRYSGGTLRSRWLLEELDRIAKTPIAFESRLLVNGHVRDYWPTAGGIVVLTSVDSTRSDRFTYIDCLGQVHVLATGRYEEFDHQPFSGKSQYWRPERGVLFEQHHRLIHACQGVTKTHRHEIEIGRRGSHADILINGQTIYWCDELGVQAWDPAQWATTLLVASAVLGGKKWKPFRQGALVWNQGVIEYYPLGTDKVIGSLDQNMYDYGSRENSFAVLYASRQTLMFWNGEQHITLGALVTAPDHTWQHLPHPRGAVTLIKQPDQWELKLLDIDKRDQVIMVWPEKYFSLQDVRVAPWGDVYIQRDRFLHRWHDGQLELLFDDYDCRYTGKHTPMMKYQPHRLGAVVEFCSQHELWLVQPRPHQGVITSSDQPTKASVLPA